VWGWSMRGRAGRGGGVRGPVWVWARAAQQHVPCRSHVCVHMERLCLMQVAKWQRVCCLPGQQRHRGTTFFSSVLTPLPALAPPCPALPPRGSLRSTYTLSDGTQRSLATTQFEANAARTAFPCFDEPAFKVGCLVWVHGGAIGERQCPGRLCGRRAHALSFVPAS